VLYVGRACDFDSMIMMPILNYMQEITTHIWFPLLSLL